MHQPSNGARQGRSGGILTFLNFHLNKAHFVTPTRVTRSIKERSVSILKAGYFFLIRRSWGLGILSLLQHQE